MRDTTQADVGEGLTPDPDAFGAAGYLLRPTVATTAADLTEAERSAVRMTLLAAMREWSEETYCAGWLVGLEHRLHRECGVWETLGRLVGWPVGVDAEGGWETWDEAGTRFATSEYQVAQYGRVVAPAERPSGE